MTAATSRWLAMRHGNFDRIAKVRLASEGLVIELTGIDPVAITSRLLDGERLTHSDKDRSAVLLPLAFPLGGGKRAVTSTGRIVTNPDPILIAALRRARSMVEWQRGLPTMPAGPVSRYDCNILRLAFLAPDIQRDILEGKQPQSLNLENFKKLDVPLCWSKQRQALGYGTGSEACSTE
ncbi:hypothetical protein [Qipengyuania vesicularis]|uniref:hypothetical protein n=1 Tax=Qipengyuania vesicularis TaxID=2867232 RepID=UPI001C888921|nr:hypothetical protein [Qipengyuania vesicularis]MBX7528636.1 hypothetical protein [Qipengyuania vesicularis]